MANVPFLLVDYKQCFFSAAFEFMLLKLISKKYFIKGIFIPLAAKKTKSHCCNKILIVFSGIVLKVHHYVICCLI